MVSVAVDTSYVVAWVDARDSLHAAAQHVRAKLTPAIQLIYFDVVFGEAVSVLGRRAHEQRRAEEFPALLASLTRLVEQGSLTWIWPYLPRLLDPTLETCKASLGKLNFNDSLMVGICRELGIRHILSFDRDFDGLPAPSRVSTPERIDALLREPASS